MLQQCDFCCSKAERGSLRVTHYALGFCIDRVDSTPRFGVKIGLAQVGTSSNTIEWALQRDCGSASWANQSIYTCILPRSGSKGGIDFTSHNCKLQSIVLFLVFIAMPSHVETYDTLKRFVEVTVIQYVERWCYVACM